MQAFSPANYSGRSGVKSWTTPRTVDKPEPHAEAHSKASGLTPPRWLCRRLNLFTQAIGAIDGSKFKAVNVHDRNFTQAKLTKRVQEIERGIDEYMTAIETADRNPSEVTETKTAHLDRKIETLKREMRDLKGMQAQLEASGGQVSLTDPDARAMPFVRVFIVG